MRREGQFVGVLRTRWTSSVRKRFIAFMGVDVPSVRTRFIASIGDAAVGTRRVCPRPMGYPSSCVVATWCAVSVAVV